ncbi:MAG: methyltransferase domain-containing protein [Bacteroidetes bacterium]|nr:methyltransferase domain-containing protein [Bacteroidota bacterium]
MRIIGGEFKGRKFYPPADNWPTRPTTDYAKEGLFNILHNSLDISELKVLDLFGGTGNHSYEFISRGCRDVTYVDRFPKAVAFAKKISRELGIEDYIRIVRADVFKFVQRDHNSYSYIFAGPPYGMPLLDTLPDRVLEGDLLAEDGLFVLEHNPKHDFQNHPAFRDMRTYGKTYFSFFRHPASEA